MVSIRPVVNVMNNGVKIAKKATKGVTNEVMTTKSHYKNNFKEGWEIGGRVARIKNQNKINTFFSKFINGIKKTSVKKEHLPGILGAIGLITPIPGGSILGYGIGKLFNTFKKLK